jgi:hypothetical protein
MLWNCEVGWSKVHMGVTNYGTLLDEIERWRSSVRKPICFVTFNYDRMLERAMEQSLQASRRPIETLADYISHDDYKVIKIHGSVDWAHAIEYPAVGTVEHAIGYAGPSLKLSTTYQKTTSASTLANGRVGFPALAIPVEKKNEFSCPPEHLTALAEFIPKVTKIIAVGWRAMEQNFLDMLHNRLTGLQNDVDLMVVSGSDADANATVKNLRMNMRSPRKRSLIGTGFTGPINNIAWLEQFLR